VIDGDLAKNILKSECFYMSGNHFSSYKPKYDFEWNIWFVQIKNNIRGSKDNPNHRRNALEEYKKECKRFASWNKGQYVHNLKEPYRNER